MNTPYLSLPLTGEPGRADVWERLRKGKDADRPRATLPATAREHRRPHASPSEDWG